MANQRRGGIIQVQIDGEIQDAKGVFSYNLGAPKRETIVGADGVHGYKETPQPGFIEGAITDRGNLDLEALVNITDATITLTLANDKTITMGPAWFSGDGTVTTDEGEIQVRFEGKNAKET